MTDSVLYTEACIEHAGDGFRWKISECDGIFRFEYQEYIGKDGSLESTPGDGEWKTKDSMEGMWCSEVDKICKALKLVAAHSEM